MDIYAKVNIIVYASLALGPMYHLQEEPDRNKAIQELYRVTRNEGIVYVAFMPRIRHVLSSLLSPENWRPNDTMESIQRFIRTGKFDHSDEGRFTGAYYFEIDHIKPFMESHGFETLNLVGSSNIGSLLSKEQWAYWQNRGENEFGQLIELLIETATDSNVLGISSHCFILERKKIISKVDLYLGSLFFYLGKCSGTKFAVLI